PPSSAAMTARADVRKIGEKPDTAMRVAGSDPLKMMTPSSPLPQPSVAVFMIPRIRPLDTSGGLAAAGTKPYNYGKLYWYGEPYNDRTFRRKPDPRRHGGDPRPHRRPRPRPGRPASFDPALRRDDGRLALDGRRGL